MSTTVDQRVVEMRFDNSNFEKNVSTTLSSLDKLKQKLNLSGAAKGLDKVNHAANNVRMTGLTAAVQTVTSKFSALEVMGVTALANITNSAVNAGKRIVRSLTIEPITTGFSEYELKMGSVQTIMASTGESLATVNKYLEELNAYSDQTIYSFSDMTQNIGKFTNAGVKLEDAVAAIKGISNEAALSGANANEASRAMYNFAQALSAGYVKLIDWKSIENANMATVGFKEELIQTAVEMKKLTKTSKGFKTAKGTVITATKNFNDSLQDQWMTSEVLIKTLKKYSDEETKIGKDATEAATKIKTFSQMLDTLKESAQSGWAQTWEIVFGDFNEGTTLWTAIGGAIDKVVGGMSKARNDFLETGLGSRSTWNKLVTSLDEVGSSTEELEENVKNIVGEAKFKSIIEEFGSFEAAVKQGEFATNDLEDALKSLVASTKKFSTDALGKRTLWWGHTGEDVKQVQALLEALDYNLGDYGVDGRIGRYTSDAIKAFQKDNGLFANGAVNAETVAALKKAADELNNTAAAAENLKDKWSQLVRGLEEKGGRQLLIDAFKKVAEQIKKHVDAIKRAWSTIFGEDAMFDGNDLYNLVVKITDIANSFKINEKAVENFEKIATGCFAALDVSVWMMSGSLKTFFTLLDIVLDAFGTNIGDILAKIADCIKKFRDWIKTHTIFVGMTKKVGNILAAIVDGIQSVIDTLLGLESVQKLLGFFTDVFVRLFGVVGEGIDSVNIDTWVGKIRSAFERFTNWLAGKDDEIGKVVDSIITTLTGWGDKASQCVDALYEAGLDIMNGLRNGIWDGAGEVFQGIVDIAKQLIDKFKAILGIHSPSKVFIALGLFVVYGLAKGLTDGFPALWSTLSAMGQGVIDVITDILANGLPAIVDFVKMMGSKLSDAFENWEFDVGSLIVIGTIIGLFIALKKLVDILEKVVNPLESLDGLFKALKTGVEDLVKAKKITMWADALKTIAIAIAIVAAAFVALSFLEWDQVGRGAVALLAVAAALGILAFAASKLDTVDFMKLSVFMVAFATTVLIVAKSFETLASIHWTDAIAAVIGAGVLFGGLIITLKTFGKYVTNADVAAQMVKAAIMFIGMAIAIRLMATAVTKLADIPKDAVIKGGGIMAAMMVVFGIFTWAAKQSAHADKAGAMFFKMAIAMGIMAVVIKILGNMSTSELVQGSLALSWMYGIFAGMILFSKASGAHADKAGILFFKMGIAIGLMAIAIKLLASLKIQDVLKGIVYLTGVFVLLGLFAQFTLFNQAEYANAGKLFLGVGVAMAFIAVAIKVLAGIKLGDILKGLAVITAVFTLFRTIAAITGVVGPNAHMLAGVFMKLSIAILILVGAIALLSILDAKAVWRGTAAISALLVCFALITAASSLITTSVAPVTMLAVTIGILAGSLIALTAMNKTEETLKIARSLSGILLALSVAMVALKFVGTAGTAAIYGAVILAAIIAALTASIWALGYFDADMTNIKNGFEKLKVIAQGIGEVVNTYKKYASSGLPQTEETSKLATLGENLAKFVESASVDASVVDGIKSLGKALVIISAAGFIDSITKANGLATLGESLPSLGDGLAQFAAKISGFDDTTVKKVKIACEAIEVLSKAESEIDGQSELSKWAFGDNSLATFVSNFGDIGDQLTGFISKFEGITPESIKTVKTACDIISVLAESSAGVDGQAGWTKDAFGDDSLLTFASQLPDLGAYLGTFIIRLDDIEPKTVDTVKKACDIISVLAEAAKSIDGEGGWFDAFDGDDSLATFTKDFGAIATDIKTLVTNINANGAFTEDDVNTVTLAGKAITALANAAKSIDGQSGFSKKVFGDNGIQHFAKNLPIVGTHLNNFVANLGTFGESQVTSINAVVTAINALAKVGNLDLASMIQYLPSLGDSIVLFGEDMVAFCLNISSLNTDRVGEIVDAFITAINNLEKELGNSKTSMETAGSDLIRSLAKGITDNTGSIDAATSDTVSEIKSGITSRTDTMVTLGKTLATKLADGLKATDSKTKVESAGKTAGGKAKDGMRAKYSAAYNAGVYLLNGLAYGLDDTNGRTAVYNAGYAAGRKAVKAMEEAMGIASPSKIAKQDGIYLGEGLVIGIESMSDKIYKSAYNTSEYAATAMSNAVSTISSLIESDIDAQPTIRPVLDLTDVRNGANSINGMLDMNPSVGVMSNVRAVSNMMSRAGQNGVNDDVISAIKNLGKQISGKTGDVYQINGVSYEEGSDVANAIKVITRAAVRERRA